MSAILYLKDDRHGFPFRPLPVLFILISLVFSMLISCGKADLLQYTEEIKVTGFDEVIVSDTTWKKRKSPYRVQHNILITEDATLTIEPGVNVYMSPGVMIMCHGMIEAKGDQDSPIYFKGISESPWNRIECFGGRFDKTGNLPVNVFHYCIVEGGGGITLRSCAGEVKGCIFRNNVSSPLRFEFSGGQIVENEVYENMTQRESASGNGAGIMVYSDKEVLIADNVVHDNFSSGGRDGGGGIYAFAYDGGDVSVIRNSVYGNLSDRNGGGIFAYACHVEDNQVRYNSTSDSGGGIYAVQSTLVNNRVRQNQAVRGGGIYSDDCRVEYNLILENTARPEMGGGLFYFGNNMIVNNTFIKNGARDFRGDTIVVSGNPEISGNNIISEYGYALKNQNHTLSMDLNASGNYWGTVAEETINELIYDWLDDAEVGLVEWIKFSENWIALAPDPPYSWSPPQPPLEKQPDQLYGRIDRNRILGRFGRLSFDVVENVLIPEGIVLQILPGTRLNIYPDVNIRVRGKLVLQGEKENEVKLTGDPDAPWGNLIFENRSVLMPDAEDQASPELPQSDEKSLLSHCIIENGHGIIMEGVGARVEDSIIRQNYGSGIKIHDAGVTVTRCLIADNTSPHNGGGIYTYGSKLVHIDANDVLNNYAEENGGGVFAYGEHANTAANLTGNRIEGNRSQADGGGVWASRSSIVDNRIFSNHAAGKGGGLFSTFAIIDGNHIATNHSAQGGGVYGETNSSFVGNKIEKNSAADSFGGGAYLNFWGMSVQNELFQKNDVRDNIASGDNPVGGVYLNGALIFSENNLFQNKGIQLYNANSVDAESLNALNCYWGTKSKTEIEKLIFDHQDDPGLARVIFEPFAQDVIRMDTLQKGSSH
jgi:hypothetical protein